MKWTWPMIAKVTTLADAGRSAAEIAAELKTTRDAIIGLCDRQSIRLPKTAAKLARGQLRANRTKWDAQPDGVVQLSAAVCGQDRSED
jgi:hypothetical protein